MYFFVKKYFNFIYILTLKYFYLFQYFKYLTILTHAALGSPAKRASPGGINITSLITHEASKGRINTRKAATKIS